MMTVELEAMIQAPYFRRWDLGPILELIPI